MWTPSRALVGKRIREERKRLGFTQSQFAKELGVGRVMQLLYEAGDNSPSVEYLQNMRRLGGDVHYIVSGDRILLDKKRGAQHFSTNQLEVVVKGFIDLAVANISRKDVRRLMELAEDVCADLRPSDSEMALLAKIESHSKAA